jgi:GNAT superfamily N-acetyltransferase
MNTVPYVEWKSEMEKDIGEVFGSEYGGYFFDWKGVRFVGFVTVKPEHRGKGLFRKLLEDLKDDMDAVVLASPIPTTIRVAGEMGYTYEEDLHRMVWQVGD